MSEQRRVDVPGVDAPDPDAPTEPSAVVSEDVRPGVHVRVFGSTAFFRLWLTQVISSIGDWLGFLAIAALAAGLPGAGSSAAAVGVVMSARRSEEHTSELQSLMSSSYAVFCLKTKKQK